MSFNVPFQQGGTFCDHSQNYFTNYAFATFRGGKGEGHLTRYLHSAPRAGGSESLHFKNMNLSYLLCLLHGEQIFSSDIRRKVLLTHPSPYFRQTALSSRPWEYFAGTTMGLFHLSIYILDSSQSPFELSLI